MKIEEAKEVLKMQMENPIYYSQLMDAIYTILTELNEKKYTKEQIIHAAKCCEISLIDITYLCRKIDEVIKFETPEEYFNKKFKFDK